MNHAEAWKEQAAQAGIDPVPARQWNPVTFDRFKDALFDTADAAGFDGWTEPELQAMLEHTPWILHELHALFIRSVRAVPFGIDEELRNAIFAWRVVGIPKRDPGESRPIAIA